MSSQVRQALITRPLDFWLLGGLSLLVLSGLMLVRQLNPEWLRSPEFWLTTGLYLRVALEYPHLLATYKLAYSRDFRFLRAHAVAMGIAPLLLLALGAFTIAALDFKLMNEPATRAAQLILSTGVHALFLGFGWHRLRQVWGCMALYARYDGLKLGPRRRLSIHAFLLSMWIFGYLHMITSAPRFEFFGVHVNGFSVPSWAVIAGGIAFATAGLFFLIENVFGVLFRGERLPSLCFFVPLVALLFWWAALSLEPAFFFFLAPSFHSLQYFAVVWAYERGPVSTPLDRSRYAWWGAAAVLLVALALIWERVPQAVLPPGSAAIAIAYMVVSLHHYLLDGVIWRSSDPRLKNLLD